jgi:hypothetical protein
MERSILPVFLHLLIPFLGSHRPESPVFNARVRKGVEERIHKVRGPKGRY